MKITNSCVQKVCYLLIMIGGIHLLFAITNGNKENILTLANHIKLTYKWVFSGAKNYYNNERSINMCSTNYTASGTKILSYTLYGRWNSDKKWLKFLQLIAKEAMTSFLYRDWLIRLYHEKDFPLNDMLKQLKTYGNVQFCNITSIPYYGDLSHISGREWRFIPVLDETVQVMCSRDIDTPILDRETSAVNEWLLSNEAFHCMRDHPQHGEWQILAGMWCFRRDQNSTLTKMLGDVLWKNFNHRNSTHEPEKVSDQKLLRDHVLPLVKTDMLQHDSYGCERYFGSLPFPTKRIRNDSGFMGCKRNDMMSMIPCPRQVPECPIKCRPADHEDWVYC